MAADLVAGLETSENALAEESWLVRSYGDDPAPIASHLELPDDLELVLAAPDPERESGSTPNLPELPQSLDFGDFEDIGIDLANSRADARSNYSDFDTESLAVSEAGRFELIIVDSSVHDYETLVSNLLSQRSESRQIQVHVVESGQDGIDLIGEILSRHTALDAVHVISHGNEHGLQVGDAWFDADELVKRAANIKTWGSALSEDADFLLYGCNLAASPQGELFLDALGRLTGADVAASSDLTGSASLGGDWQLERATGVIETATVFGAKNATQWRGLLATVTVDTTADAVNGTVTSVSNLISNPGSDGISLREAIIATNATSGADEIILGPGNYMLTLGPAWEDLAAGGDLDILGDLTITGADSSTTIIDGNANDRVFHLLFGATVDISGVTVQNGGVVSSGAGIYVESGTQLDLSDSIVRQNLGDVGSGIRNEGSLTLTDVSLTGNGNGSTSIGGGLANSLSADAVLNRVTVSGNRADTGGGIHNQNNAASLSLINVTLSGNAATTVGGGLFTRESLTITNSTVTANSASDGGGIAVSGGGVDVIMSNTIVAGNTDSGTAPDFMGGTLSSQGFNLIGDTTGAIAVFVGTDKLNVVSNLDPTLAYNGGPTKTHALLSGSGAINAITAGASAVDQRGLSRDSAPDIGAFEVHVSPALWVTTDDDVDTDNDIPGLHGSSWQAGDLLAMTDPNLGFGDGSTNGTFSVAFDSDLFWPGSGPKAEINGVHYVSRDLTIGSTNSFDLQPGDLLLTTHADTTFKSNAATPESDLPITKKDVVVFRPEDSGDYSKGNFFMLLEDPLGHEIRGISLIEQDTWVGDMWLREGDFLFSRSGQHSDVKLFETIDVEDTSPTRTTDGTTSDLLAGGDLKVDIDEQIYGLELLENTLTIGGTTLNAGTILVKLENGDSLGANNISVNKHDVVSLNVSQTTLGSGPGAGDVTVRKFFDGNGVFFDDNKELISGLSLITTGAPAANATPDGIQDTYTVDEDTPLDSNDDWFDSNWSFRRTLSFDNAGRGQDLNDFPVLVTLDSSRIDYGQTQGGGEDLRFVDGDGALLAYEIEEWNESGTSYVWVKVPQIDASSGKDFIWMYYGNAGAASGENASAVWSNGFQAVYHLEQDPGATGTLDDSTGAFDGTNAGSTDVAALIGRGQAFDGSSEYIDMGNDQPFLNNATGATVSGWMRADDTAEGNILGVSIAGGPTDSSRVTLNLVGDSLHVFAISDDLEPHQSSATAAGIINTATWHYVTGVVNYATGDLTVYVDGVERASTTVAFSSAATLGTNSWRGVIGANENTGSRWFDGVLDEVRLADAARSAHWISAQYASTTDNLITYGYEQSVAGVLGNDIDGNGDPLTATLAVGPTNASAFSLNPDGSFTYTPAADFNGIDTFQYRANDGTANSGMVTVTITVNPINDPPTTTPVTLAPIAEDGSARVITQAELLANASDAEGDSLTASGLAISAGFGTLVDNGNGTWNYTPALNDDTTVSFSYSITGGTDNVAASAALDITPVNDPPTTSPVTLTGIAEDSGVRVITQAELLANAWDIEGESLTASSLAINAGSGTLVDNGNGTWNYTPALNDSTGVSFSYSVTDGTDNVAGSAALDLTPVNDTPTATIVASAFGFNEDDGYRLLGGISVSDPDAGSSELAVTLDVNSGVIRLANTTGLTFTGGANDSDSMTFTGTLVDLNAALASVAYRPNANFFGTDILSLSVNDQGHTGGGPLTANDTANISVASVNDAPATTPVTLTPIAEGSGVRLITQAELLSNASDVEGDGLTASGLSISAGSGTLVDNGNGTWNYVPAADDDTAVSFSYSITDGTDTVAGSAALDITAVNDAPTTASVTLTAIAEGSGVRLITQAELLANASDVEGDSLAATGLAISAGTGTLADNGNGTWNYAPAADDDTAVGFSYTITDGTDTVAGSATLDITPVNDAPTTTPVTLAPIAEDSGTRVIAQAELLGNASDTEGDSLSATDLAISSGSGTLVDNDNGTWNFTPAANDNTAVSFSYGITDGTDTVAGSATLDITAVNDAPTTAPVSLTAIAEDSGVRLITQAELLADASDVEGDSLAVTGLTISAGTGTLVDNGDGTWNYTPAANDDSSVSFSYSVTDSTETVAGSATLDITAVNDVPVAIDDSTSTAEDSAVIIGNVLTNDDPGDEPTSVTAYDVTSANGGTVVTNGDGTISYTPAADFNGGDSFTYTITDQDGETSTATVTVTVTPVNDAPVAVGEGYRVAEGQMMTVSVDGVLGNDSDADADPLTAVLVVAPAHGSLSFNPDGTFVYVPDLDFSGTDNFVYRASDGANDSKLAVVVLTVEPVSESSGGAETPRNDDAPNADRNATDPTPSLPFSSTPNRDPEPVDSLPDRNAANSGIADRASGADQDLTKTFNPADQIRRGPGGGAAQPGAVEEVTEEVVEQAAPPTEVAVNEGNQSPAVLEEPPPEPISIAGTESTSLGNDLASDDGRRLYFLRGENDFTRELDSLRKTVEDTVVIDQTVIGSGVVMATGISVGYVLWMTRGGLLLLSLVSSMPAWRLVDPIPVLGRLRQRQDEEDDAGESLRSLVEAKPSKEGAAENNRLQHKSAPSSKPEPHQKRDTVSPVAQDQGSEIRPGSAEGERHTKEVG